MNWTRSSRSFGGCCLPPQRYPAHAVGGDRLRDDPRERPAACSSQAPRIADERQPGGRRADALPLEPAGTGHRRLGQEIAREPLVEIAPVPARVVYEPLVDQ